MFSNVVYCPGCSQKSHYVLKNLVFAFQCQRNKKPFPHELRCRGADWREAHLGVSLRGMVERKASKLLRSAGLGVSHGLRGLVIVRGWSGLVASLRMSLTRASIFWLSLYSGDSTG